MSEDLDNKKKDKWTRLMFVVLVFFGVSTLILGVLEISQTINLSTLYSNELSESGLDLSAGLENIDRSIEELKASDTDGDGLSDFDEMYSYNTSIYLADSDADGYSDKQEIDDGYDPNCPKGMDCRGAANGSQQATGDSEQTTGDSGQNNLSDLSDEEKEQLKNLSTDEVRQLLLASGQISQEELDKIDDETLMQVFWEMINQ